MIQGIITEQDLRAAAWTNLRPRPSLAILGVVLALLFGSGLWFAFFGSRRPESEWTRWGLSLVPLYFLWMFAIWLPYKVRKTYQQRKDLHRPCTYIPSDDGLGAETDRASGVKPWADYLKWKEGKSVLLLYMSDDMFQIVPKHFFPSPDDFASFRRLVKDKIERYEA